jgi:hypothetical protein
LNETFGVPMAKLTITRKQIAEMSGIDPVEDRVEAQQMFNDLVVTMKGLASEFGLRGATQGVSPTQPKTFILIGPRSAVEEFANALDVELFAGPQSISDEISTASQIVDLGIVNK